MAFLGVAIAALHQVGVGPPLGSPGRWTGWVSDSTGVEAAFALLRLLALGLTWYLLVSTVLALGAELPGADRAAAALDPFTIPLVRSLVRSAVGLGLVGALAVTVPPAPGSGPPRAHLVAHQQPVEPEPSLPPTIRRLPDAGGAPTPTPPAPAPAPVPADPGPTWVIAPGDHLWSVASRVVARERSAPTATDDQVAPYWRALIAANREVLADPANPDLVFPGQVLRLPAPTGP